MFNFSSVRRVLLGASASGSFDGQVGMPGTRASGLGGWIMSSALVLGAVLSAVTIASAAPVAPTHAAVDVTFGTIKVDGLNIAYREAGDPSSRKLVLLHGFPASSHQYRDLIRVLGDKFHVIAPDYPGFGNSDAPDPAKYAYTFDKLSDVVETFLAMKGFDH